MSSRISIGQYFIGDSIIHKLDPRVKILLSIIIMISIFMSWNYIAMAVICIFIFGIMIISRVPLKLYIGSAKIILLFAFLSSVLNLFYGSGEPLFKLGFLTITEAGIKSGVIVMVRISSLLFMGSALTFTTSPNDMTYAIESIMKPLSYFNVNVQDIAMTTTISLRFIPTLFEEANKIIRAQRSRGADMKSKNLVKRVKSFIPVLLPLFISSFRRAYDLAIAMECRCYNSLNKRTHMKELKIGGYDVIAVLLTLIILTSVSICSIYQIEKI